MSRSRRLPDRSVSNANAGKPRARPDTADASASPCCSARIDKNAVRIFRPASTCRRPAPRPLTGCVLKGCVYYDNAAAPSMQLSGAAQYGQGQGQSPPCPNRPAARRPAGATDRMPDRLADRPGARRVHRAAPGHQDCRRSP